MNNTGVNVYQQNDKKIILDIIELLLLEQQ